jgi:hypothetical protein
VGKHLATKARSGEYTIAMSAPRNSTAWAKATKCGVGLMVRIRFCSGTGLFCIGVLLPGSNGVTIGAPIRA